MSYRVKLFFILALLLFIPQANAAGVKISAATNIVTPNGYELFPVAHSTNGGVSYESAADHIRLDTLAIGIPVGAGITHAGGTLNTTYTFRDETTTSGTISSTDAGTIVVSTNSGATAFAIASASTSGLTSGFAFSLIAQAGAGTVTLTPTGSTIGGFSSIAIPAGTGCSFYSDGTNYQIQYDSCTALGSFGAGSFTGVVTISKNATALPTALTGTMLQAANADATASRIELDAYGAQAFYSGACTGGTNASKTAITSGTQCGGYNSYMYNGASLVGPLASIRTFAAETQSSGHGGSYVEIATTPNASTTMASVIRFASSGGVLVPPTVTGGDKGAGTINAAGLYVNGTSVVDTLSTLGLATSSTDQTLVRFSGTAGHTQGTGITVSSANEVSGAIDLVVTDSSTARTMASTDCGTTVLFTSGSAITVTLPNSLVAGCSIEEIQGGAGQITFAAGASATLNNAHSQTKTFGQYATVRTKVRSNAGSAAVWNLAGDTGT